MSFPFLEGDDMCVSPVLLVCLFSCFTSQVNSEGHGETVSSPNDFFSWAGFSDGPKGGGGGGGACECPKKKTFFTHYLILRVYTVMHNWERLLI